MLLQPLHLSEPWRGRVYGFSTISGEALFLPDWSTGFPDKVYLENLSPMPIEAYRKRRIDECINYNESFFSNPAQSFTNLVGTADREVAVLVLAGPSAVSINYRLAKWRDRIRVFTLNLGAQAVQDADYFFCGEPMAKEAWLKGVDPAKTKLLATVHVANEISRHWEMHQQNAYWAWIRDCRGAADPRFAHLESLTTSGTTAVTALHAINRMGFKHILVIGCDFAVTKLNPKPNREWDGWFYFDGTRLTSSYYNGHPMQLYIGIDSAMCAASAMLLCHGKAFEAACECAEAAGSIVYNCAGQGTLHHRPSVLEDVLESLCPSLSATFARTLKADSATPLMTTPTRKSDEPSSVESRCLPKNECGATGATEPESTPQPLMKPAR